MSSSVGCVEQTPVSLVCAPQCQTSCTAVCPPACCVTAHGVYSSPVVPLQSVYTNRCPSPCPSSCAPRCSSKCCNAVIYRSPAFHLKRKFIGRKKIPRKEKLRRKLHNLHHLKNVVKLQRTR